MRQVVTNIADIFSDKIDILKVLRADDILNQMYVPADASDRPEFIQHLPGICQTQVAYSGDWCGNRRVHCKHGIPNIGRQ